jgi:hypothetical protein
MSTFTPPTQRKEYRLENYRTCEICGDDVNCGIEGMVSHLDANHTFEEIAKEVSFEWQPNEPTVFHHPNGTVHFYQSGGGDMVTTMCGRTFERHNSAPDETREDWFDRINYEHADADDYCGNCIQLYEHKFPGTPLPEPLEDE